MAVQSRRYGMAPAQIPVILFQKPSSKIGVIRVTVLFYVIIRRFQRGVIRAYYSKIGVIRVTVLLVATRLRRDQVAEIVEGPGWYGGYHGVQLSRLGLARCKAVIDRLHGI